jgi:nucleoside-diphosphate-sugar epimerase
MKKKILIIGGTGFLGFHLCKYFLKKKMLVSSISLSEPKKKRKLRKVKYFIADISNKKNLTFLKRLHFNFVVNCGGYVDHFNKIRTYNSHFKGCKNIFNLFEKKNIDTLIQIGSCTEYGHIKSPQLEKHQCTPLTIYGKAKLQATKFLIKKNKEIGFPVVILRFYQIYGPYQDNNRFMSFIINSCLKNKKFPCSEGKQYRDFLYVDDAVKAIDKCLDNKKAYGKIFNIGLGKVIKLKKLINKVKGIIKKGEPNFGIIKMRKDEPMVIVPNINEAKQKLRWKPQMSIKNGLLKTINFYKKNVFI